METYIQADDPTVASCLSCHGSARTSGTLADGKTSGSANFSYLLQTAMPIATSTISMEPPRTRSCPGARLRPRPIT